MSQNLLKFRTQVPTYNRIFHKKIQPIISKGSEVTNTRYLYDNIRSKSGRSRRVASSCVPRCPDFNVQPINDQAIANILFRSLPEVSFQSLEETRRNILQYILHPWWCVDSICDCDGCIMLNKLWQVAFPQCVSDSVDHNSHCVGLIVLGTVCNTKCVNCVNYVKI